MRVRDIAIDFVSTGSDRAAFGLMQVNLSVVPALKQISVLIEEDTDLADRTPVDGHAIRRWA
jgi:hypothetical protein